MLAARRSALPLLTLYEFLKTFLAPLTARKVSARFYQDQPVEACLILFPTPCQ